MLWTRVTNRRAGVLMVPQGSDALPALLEMVGDGRLTPVVGEVTSLDCSRRALIDMGARRIAGKLVVVP
jgi:NADPH:quinone reductase-like Zn-dependent oxidoreductase